MRLGPSIWMARMLAKSDFFLAASSDFLVSALKKPRVAPPSEPAWVKAILPLAKISSSRERGPILSAYQAPLGSRQRRPPISPLSLPPAWLVFSLHPKSLKGRRIL